MKNHFRRLLALVLVLCMVCPMALNAQAASWIDNDVSVSVNWGKLLAKILDDIWDYIYEEEETEPEPEKKPEPETEPEVETEAPSAGNSDDPGMDLVLVEDQDMVSPMVMMRASVYAADENDPAAQAELGDNNVVYYPSTLINYDVPTNNLAGGINQSMADLDVQYAVDHGLSTDTSDWSWKGLYFGAGGSGGDVSDREETQRTGTYIPEDADYTVARNVTYGNLATSNVTNSLTSYYYYDTSSGVYYPVYVTRSGYFNGYYTYTLYANNKQIDRKANASTSTALNTSATLYVRGTTVASDSHASWVKWGLNDKAAQGAYIHAGLVTHLENGVPQFAESYASRLFDSSALAGKTRYENVGLPFILDEDGYYTFDAASNGVRFENGAASGENLEILDAPTTMSAYTHNFTDSWSSANVTCFMPFNNFNGKGTTSTGSRGYTFVTPNGNNSGAGVPYYSMSNTQDFFFSMTTNVPFNMTENGREYANQDNSEPIIFEFSGDDDVWVFIDGVLILDLGGIHDAVTGTINFAENTVTFGSPRANQEIGDAMGLYETGNTGSNGTNTISQGRIFNDENGTGKLNMDRSTFAATDNHTLTVIYVERGANVSNCKIRFNLPQKDYVAVTKQIDENLYKNTDENQVVEQITDELFATLNQRDFTYILYEDNNPMIGVRFSRYDANGTFVGNGTTASDGTFNVKNGETVRFYDVDFSHDDGDGLSTYYVAEKDPDAGSKNNAWGAASWKHTISTAYADSAEETDPAEQEGYYLSKAITTEGSTEAVDVVYFTNTNKLLSPVADIADDEYVIDYGLTVVLNPLANDTYSATTDSLILTGISMTAPNASNSDPFVKEDMEGKYGTLSISGNQLIYTLNRQFTGVETFYYQVGLEKGELEGVYGTITIMPATTMYYEENFDGLINYLTGTWETVGTSNGGVQEEGRVGTTTDSPYGSDNVYKNNPGDSYGTSQYVNTKNERASFSFTFTGTGAALYARTSDKSAYMIITVYDQDGNRIEDEWRRNTIYKPVDGTELPNNTLYNIPVYVYQAPEYGTYTVNVALNKAMVDSYQDENGEWHDYEDVYSRGCDFHLDGIRVYNPANAYTGERTDDEIKQIQDAYARDGEAYITVDTLRNKLLTDYTMYQEVLDEEGNPVVDEYGDPVYEIAWDGVNYVVFTDSNGEIKDAQTYQSAGPKEEVYMNAGQSVTFSLANWDHNRNRIYLGIKAPTGTGTVSINGREIKLDNTTDIYFDITSYANVQGEIATFEITAVEGLISVTTIKVTGTADFTILNPVSGEPEEPEDGE